MKLKFQNVRYETKNFTKRHTYDSVEVTPQLATELMTLNSSNRPQRRRAIDQYAADMTAGKWIENGDAIVISKTGKLLQGQHRLLAVIKSGVTIRQQLTTGLEDEAFKTMDIGRTRTAGDTCAFMGYKNTGTMAGLVKWIISYTMNNDFHKSHKQALSNQDVASYIELLDAKDVERIESASSKASGYSKRYKGISLSQAAFFYWLFTGIDRERGEEFMRLLVTSDGIGSTFNSSIWHLRNKLEGLTGANHMHTDLTMRNALIIKAWNFFKTNTEIKQLKWQPTEEFPTVK